MYKRNAITESSVLETVRISPSSINTFRQCNRRWYFEYILAKESAPTIHLLRGTAVHQVLEELFKRKSFPSGEKFREEMLTEATMLLQKAWKEHIDPFEEREETKAKSFRESESMINRFVNKFCDNIQLGIENGQYSSERQGYYFLKPTFKELWLDDEYETDTFGRAKLDKDGNKIPLPDSLHVGGFIDAVNKDFENNKILVDYKTSKKYKNALSEEYVLQLAIYAYLYSKQMGELPAYVAINYLKYDEVFFIQVTPSLIEQAKQKLQDMRRQIVAAGIDSKCYPANPTKLCNWCPFQKECGEIEEQLKGESQ